VRLVAQLHTRDRGVYVYNYFFTSRTTIFFIRQTGCLTNLVNRSFKEWLNWGAMGVDGVHLCTSHLSLNHY